MTSLESAVVFRGMHHVLSELMDGAPPGPTWVLDHDPKAGLLPMLESVDASAASRRLDPARPTIAAHANHLRFSLSLLNRWAGGEENPFAGADWKGSWKVQEVTENEWRSLRDALRTEARAWAEAIRAPREWDELAISGSIASVAHMAYHLAAMRHLVLHAKAG